MKSIFKLSALALLATAMTVSCEKEMAVEDAVAHQMERHTFTLTFAQPDTKLGVTNEGKTTWEVGDEIMIHGGTDGALRQKVTLTADDISKDGKKAVITFEMDPYLHYDKEGNIDVTSKYYAQYPARLVPEGNMYYEARFTATNDFLMAACDVDDNFVFYNLCGIIAFKAEGEFDSFAFEGNNGETVGYSSVYQARVRLDPGKDAPSVNYNKPGNGSGEPVPMKSFKADKQDGVNYVFLPAGAKFSAGFTFKFYDGVDLVKIAKTETPVEVGPSQILYLDDISSKLEDFVPPTTSDHKPAEWAAAATDLSLGGKAAANCYVLTAPGVYKIPALKGNSEDAAGNVFDVELLWETYNNDEEVVANSVIADVDFDNDNIYFKTPDALKAGNALIAAKDFEGKIIWSWHIWIPKNTIATNTYGLFPQELMDRNLGALEAAVAGSPAPVESFGLTYQWGRKDPFVGPANNSEKSNATVAGTAPTAAEGQMTIGETIANPTVIGHSNDADWLTAPDNTLWQNNEKTIYDPCPAGYKVPARDKEQPLFSGDLSAVTGWASDPTNKLFVLGNPTAVFPLGGYRDDYSVGKVDKVGIRVAIWSSYASSDAKGYLLDIRVDEGSVRQKLSEGPKARGGYVRCVKDAKYEGPTPEQPKEPALERVWGLFNTGEDAYWFARVKDGDAGMAATTDRNIAMDDDYIYLAKSSSYPQVFAIDRTDPSKVKKLPIDGIAGGTHPISCVRVIKNTDSSVNGGKDILLVSNLKGDYELKVFAYLNGIDAAPTQVLIWQWDNYANASDWRRYGDKFTVTGTWQSGAIWFQGWNDGKALYFPITNNAIDKPNEVSHVIDATASSIKDIAVYPGQESEVFITSYAKAAFWTNSGTKNGNNWVVWNEGSAIESLKNTYGYNFFSFNGKNYIAYTRIEDTTHSRVQVMEDNGAFKASLEAKAGLLELPLQHESDFATASPAAGQNNGDCVVRTIGGDVYIAALGSDMGLSLFKVVLK